MIILNFIIEGLKSSGWCKGCLFHENQGFNVYMCNQSYIKSQANSPLISHCVYNSEIGNFKSPGIVGLTAIFYLGGNMN